MKNFTTISKLGKFSLRSPAGEGAFSTVYKVRRASDNQIYALKKVRLPLSPGPLPLRSSPTALINDR